MTTFRPKLWTGVSVAIMLSAAAACSSEAGEQGAATTEPAAAVGEGGEGGAEGGAGGEAGAQSAYASVPAESRVALRLAHLKGFLLIAQKQPDGPEAAAALVGQGVTEVYDAQPGAFESAGLDIAAVRKAAETGSAADLTAALAAIEAAQGRAKGDDAAVVKGMVGIAQGLYAEVNIDGAVDPVEYQHSLGAALAAQQVAAKSANDKVKASKADLDKLVGMWPGPVAPEAPAPAGQVSAQAARVELALS